MKQQDWIDFFQAVHGRNPSIQEMAEAANRGEFIRETPKQTVEATKNLSQKETVETAENDVDNYDVAEEPLVDSSIDERQTFQTPNLGQEAPTANFQEQINPIQGTTNKSLNSFAEHGNASFQHPSHNFNETWTQHENKSQTNLIMIAIASIPVILWALAMILFGIASDDLSDGLLTAVLSIIIFFPLVVLQILPALLNKTDKKWPIFILSFLRGWTFIGWVIFLVVSINTNKEAERIRQQQVMMQMSGNQGSSDMFNPFH